MPEPKQIRLIRAVWLLCPLLVAPSLQAQVPPGLDKGHRILLERGFQLQATAVDQPEVPNWSTFADAGWNAVDFSFNYFGPANYLGPAPGNRPWAAWYSDYGHTSFTSAEAPYAANCVAIQLDDEQDLNNATVRANVANWFAAARANYPDTILHINQIPFAASDAAYREFMVNSQPDMLMMDSYPFNVGNSTGTWNLFSDMQRHRRFGLSGHDGSGTRPIPYALYPQAIKSDFWRVPSESELRVNHFAGWAMGYTLTRDFTYNTYFDYAQSIFFNAGYQQASPTPSYYQVTEINRQGANLGPALVRLLSTDLRFVNGQHRDAGNNIVSNPNPIDIPNWAQGVGDPYLRGIAVANAGTKNDNLPGDVLLSWFKPLHESFDGDAYGSEAYFAVTNALVDPSGSAVDCRQQITLTFDSLASGISSLQRLRRDDGVVEVLPLTPIPGNRYSLTVTLDGGTADLFKFNDGAPFVGIPSAGFMYWDNDAAAAGNDATSGAGLGGSGSWNAGAPTWWFANEAGGGGADTAPSAGANAVFWGDVAGTVTLAAPQTVNALTFKTTGYTLAGSTLNVTSSFIAVDSGATATISSLVAGNSGLVKVGGGTLNLTAANPYSGVTTINAGVLGIASSSFSAEPGSPALNIAINNGSTLRFSANGLTFGANRNVALGSGGGVIDTDGNTATIAGSISGTTLTKTGAGVLVVNGANTYSGGTIVNGGVLRVSSDASLGPAPASLATNLTIAGGTLQWGANFDLANTRGIDLGTSGGTIDTNGFSNPAGYSATNGFRGGNLTKVGAGTFFASATTIGNNNLWTGNLIIKQGIWKIVGTDGLPFNPPASAGLQAGQITLDGGTWQIGANVSATNGRRGITVAAGGGTIDTQSFDLTWQGPLAGNVTSAVLNKTGSGTLRLNTSGVAAATYAGVVNVNAGTLRLDGGAAMGDLASVQLADVPGATLNITGNETLGSVSGGGAAGGNVTLASAVTLTTGANNDSAIYAGAISGTGGKLKKIGSGTLTLSGAATHTGGTTVDAGVLASTKGFKGGGPLSIASGAVAMVPEASPATHDPGANQYPSGNNGSASRVSSLTIAGTGRLDLGNSDMVVDHNGTSPLGAVLTLLASGFNGGGWDGPGVISSGALHTDPSVFALGYAENADLPTPYSTGVNAFFGTDVDSTSVLIKFTWVGDLNLDGFVDFQDLSVFNTSYDSGASSGHLWTEGDFNYDGFIDFSDLSLFNTNYDPSKPSLPEPAVLAVFAAAALGCVRRRTRGIRNRCR